jgi:hypothetical protein
MEIANMTLEQVSKVTSMLGTARLAAYLTSVGGHTFLYAVPDEQRVVWDEEFALDV